MDQYKTVTGGCDHYVLTHKLLLAISYNRIPENALVREG